MIIISGEDDWWYYNSGKTEDCTVFEKDEVQVTSVLGPDGTPYAIRRPKVKVGFDLSPR